MHTVGRFRVGQEVGPGVGLPCQAITWPQAGITAWVRIHGGTEA